MHFAGEMQHNQLAHEAVLEWAILWSYLNQWFCSACAVRAQAPPAYLIISRALKVAAMDMGFNPKSCFLATFKRSMKPRVENLTNQPPAVNPSWWAVFYRLRRELFLRAKKGPCSFPSLFQQQRLHITEGPFVYLAGLFLLLGEKSLIQAIPKCQYVLSNAWPTSVSIQGIDRTSDIHEYWHVNTCTHTERRREPDGTKLWINVPWKRINQYLTQREIIMGLVSCYIRKT